MAETLLLRYAEGTCSPAVPQRSCCRKSSDGCSPLPDAAPLQGGGRMRWSDLGSDPREHIRRADFPDRRECARL